VGSVLHLFREKGEELTPEDPISDEKYKQSNIKKAATSNKNMLTLRQDKSLLILLGLTQPAVLPAVFYFGMHCQQWFCAKLD